MLESQGNLQMEYGLPMALEPEVTRFDDPCMHWTHGYLVDFLSAHLEEIHDGGEGTLISPPRTGTIGPGQVVAERLEPGMALGNDPELFGDFPFKEVSLRALRREGRISRLGEPSPGHPKAPLP